MAVDQAVLDARCIWRATPLQDVGIDGQIEYVDDDGVATGRIVAVQVKSGQSYFRRVEDGCVLYSPDVRHREYWSAFPLPVILVLHDPEASRAIWTDARAALRRHEVPIQVDLACELDGDGVKLALTANGPLPVGHEDLDGLIREMVETDTGDPGFDVSYLDLFCQGLTDIAFSLYFGMDLATMLAEIHADRNGLGGFGFNSSSYDFIDNYVAFLVAHDLARVDFDTWRQTAIERQMTGSFISPLTDRGRRLTRRISELEVELLGDATRAAVVQERFVAMRPDELEPRTERIEHFKQAFR